MCTTFAMHFHHYTEFIIPIIMDACFTINIIDVYTKTAMAAALNKLLVFCCYVKP